MRTRKARPASRLISTYRLISVYRPWRTALANFLKEEHNVQGRRGDTGLGQERVNLAAVMGLVVE